MKCSRILPIAIALNATLVVASLGQAQTAPAASTQAPVQPRRGPIPGSSDDPNVPYKTYNSTPAILMGPLLLDMSDTSVEIEWITDTASDEKIKYGEGTPDHIFVPQVDGLIPVGTVHRVTIDGLLPGHTYQYQVSSRRVISLKPYWPDMGLNVDSPTYTFTTFDIAKKNVSFAVITDTHEDVNRIHALMDMIHQHPVDFVVHDGDNVNWGENEIQLKDKFLEPMATGLQGKIPLIYARGNHDYRGQLARSFGDYLHSQNGKYYYTRDDGPLHMVVVDTGEDKADSTNVYAGLNNLHDYRNEEFMWLQNVLKDEKRVKSAPFTVLLAHQPAWGWLDGNNDKWMQLANQAHVDLFIAGHLHRFRHIKPGEQGNDFPILVVGQDQVAHVETTDQELKVKLTDRTGKVIDEFTIERKKK